MNLDIFIVSFFAFIVSIMAALGSFFERRWKRMSLLLACILVSGAVTFFELYLWLAPPPPHELPLVIRQSLSPL